MVCCYFFLLVVFVHNLSHRSLFPSNSRPFESFVVVPSIKHEAIVLEQSSRSKSNKTVQELFFSETKPPKIDVFKMLRETTLVPDSALLMLFSETPKTRNKKDRPVSKVQAPQSFVPDDEYTWDPAIREQFIELLDQNKTGDFIRLMNRYFCKLTGENAPSCVLMKVWNPQFQRVDLVAKSFSDFKTTVLGKFEKRMVNKKGEETFKETFIFDEWANITGSADYAQRRFIPYGYWASAPLIDNRTLNTFGGLNCWRLYPLAKSRGIDFAKAWNKIQHMLAVILYVWCHGNEQYMRYILFFFFWTAQNPHIKNAWTPVIQGPQGCGKTAILNYLARVLFGPQYYKSISDASLIVGNFNGSIMEALLIIAEEAFFRGDRAQQNKLKDYITSSEVHCNEKFQVAYTTKNYFNFVAPTNHDNPVAVDLDDRRFCFFKASDDLRRISRTEKRKIFEKLYADFADPDFILSTCVVALEVDLTEYRKYIGQAPNTVWSVSQRISNLIDDPVMSWWFNALSFGKIPFSNLDKWPERMPVMDVFGSIQQSHKGKKSGYITYTKVVDKLMEVANVHAVTDNKNMQDVVFPPLELCRARFEQIVEGFSWAKYLAQWDRKREQTFEYCCAFRSEQQIDKPQCPLSLQILQWDRLADEYNIKLTTTMSRSELVAFLQNLFEVPPHMPLSLINSEEHTTYLMTTAVKHMYSRTLLQSAVDCRSDSQEDSQTDLMDAEANANENLEELDRNDQRGLFAYIQKHVERQGPWKRSTIDLGLHFPKLVSDVCKKRKFSETTTDTM
jgi:Family of unknown function (DUF5906)